MSKLHSLDDLAASIKVEMRTLFLLDDRSAPGYPPATTLEQERLVVCSLLEGWGRLEDVSDLEPEDFSFRLAGLLFAFLRSARKEGRQYPDESIARAFEGLGYCREEALLQALKRLRRDVAVVLGERVADAAVTIRRVARLRRTFGELAKLDAELRAATHLGQAVDLDQLEAAALDAVEALRGS